MTAGPTPGFDSIGSVGARAAGLAVAGAFGQGFVVAREVYVAAQVGTSANLDALLVALIAPTIAASLLSGSAQAALVPAMLELNASAGRRAARHLAGWALTGIVAMGTVAAVLIVVLEQPAIAIGGPGLSDASRLVAATFLPALLPLIVFAPLGTLLAGVCQVDGMFRAIAASWVAGPIVALLVTVAAWSRAGVGALALATSMDAVATAVVLVILLVRAGKLPLPGSGVPRDAIVRFVRHAAPLAAGSSVLQLNLLTDRAVASVLSTGAVSALRYGERIIRTPISVLQPAWATTIYPAVAGTVAMAGEGLVGPTVSEALRYVIAIFVPLSVATAALAPVVVAFAFERGAFGVSAAAATAGVVTGFAPLVLLWLVQPILVAAHNARRRGGLLGRVAVLNAALNLLLNIAFGLVLGVAGVALSTSITALLLVTVLSRRLRDLEPDFDLPAVVAVGRRSLVAALVPGIPIAAICWLVRPELDLVGELGFLVASSVLGGAAYLGMCRLLQLSEPWVTVTAVAAIGRRRFRAIR